MSASGLRLTRAETNRLLSEYAHHNMAETLSRASIAKIIEKGTVYDRSASEYTFFRYKTLNGYTNVSVCECLARAIDAAMLMFWQGGNVRHRADNCKHGNSPAVDKVRSLFKTPDDGSVSAMTKAKKVLDDATNWLALNAPPKPGVRRRKPSSESASGGSASQPVRKRKPSSVPASGGSASQPERKRKPSSVPASGGSASQPRVKRRAENPLDLRGKLQNSLDKDRDVYNERRDLTFTMMGNFLELQEELKNALARNAALEDDKEKLEQTIEYAKTYMSDEQLENFMKDPQNEMEESQDENEESVAGSVAGSVAAEKSEAEESEAEESEAEKSEAEESEAEESETEESEDGKNGNAAVADGDRD